MKMINKQITLLILIVSCGVFSSRHSLAQQVDPNAMGYYNYVPQFSAQAVLGSARMQGLAGAGVSLGGDIGQIPLNPASLGLFRKSEMQISIGLGTSGVDASYLGSSTRANKTWFGIPNFGAVFNLKKENSGSSGFQGGSLGISFTKINNYQENVAMSGVNTQNSMTDYFVDISQGTSISSINNQDINNPNTLQALAYNSYLTEYDNTSNSFYRPFIYSTSQQREYTSKKGGQYSWDVAYGANFNDRVYIGAGSSMLVTNYRQERKFEEKVLPSPNGLSSFTFTENDYHRGTGFNLKLGAIVKVTDWMRIGGSVHTPTYNYMRETYSWGITTQYDNVILSDGSTLTGTDIKTTTNVYDYRFVKPMRLSGGLTLLAGKHGFITADLEYVPYAASSFQDKRDAFVFIGDNSTIRSMYKNVVNYKIGAELRLTSEYRLRGGFAYNADPYKYNDGVNRDMYYVSGGAGARFDTYYIDFAVVQGWGNRLYKPYVLSNGQEPTAVFKNHYGFYQFTTGFYF